MPLRSRIIYDLPPDLRRELEQRIIADGYSRYDAHVQWLANRGHHISLSSIKRFGRQLRKIEHIRAATREAEALVASTEDSGALADATVRLAQGALYDLIQATEDHDLKALASAARAVADLARASRSIRDEQRMSASQAADIAVTAALSAGVSPANEALIRAAFEPR